MSSKTPSKSNYCWSDNFTFENHNGIKAEPKRNPVVLSCGVGVDSVAMLVLLTNPKEAKKMGYDVSKWQKIDAVSFADPGNERPHTYDLLPKVSDYCKKKGIPFYVSRRWGAEKGGFEPIGDMMIRNGVIPLIPGSKHICSMKYKVQVQHWALDFIFGGVEIKKMKSPKGSKTHSFFGDRMTMDYMHPGFEVTYYVGINGDEKHRTKCGAYTIKSDDYHSSEMPMFEMNISRDAEKEIIANIAPELGYVRKSSCNFCPFMKEEEIEEIINDYSEEWDFAKLMEDRFKEHSPKAHAEYLKHGSGRGRWKIDSWANGARLFARMKGMDVHEIEVKIRKDHKVSATRRERDGGLLFDF